MNLKGIPYGPAMLSAVTPPRGGYRSVNPSPFFTNNSTIEWGVYRSVNPPRGVYTSKSGGLHGVTADNIAGPYGMSIVVLSSL